MWDPSRASQSSLFYFMRKSVGMNNLLEPFVTGGTYLRCETPIPTRRLRLHIYSFGIQTLLSPDGRRRAPSENFQENSFFPEKLRKVGEKKQNTTRTTVQSHRRV